MTTSTPATTRVAADAPAKPTHVIRTLLHSLREYKKESLLTPLAVAVEAIMEIVIPTVMANLID